MALMAGRQTGVEARRSLLAAKVLLTITCFEFFGPIARDTNWTHLLNPTWPGHARIHLVWFLSLIFFSGLANLYLVWLRSPHDVRDLWLSVYWQAANLASFWIACLFSPLYGGAITLPDTHVRILGIDENVAVFAVLSAILAAAVVSLRGSQGGYDDAH
jgi:hypothetical protein